VICLDEYLSVIVVLIIVSAFLPVLRTALANRYAKLRTDCLLIANENDWISIEEIALECGTSIKKTRTHVEKGIEKGVILGHVENDIFVRRRHRDPNEVMFGWPDDEMV
jgi:hypothetical protein